MNFNDQNLANPGFFRENRVDAHSDHIAYASLMELQTGKSSLRHSLNGYWKFYHAMNESQTIPGFEQPDVDCRGWADIAVPAHIQMEGYGVPHYCNTQYPWDGYQDIQPGEIPTAYNPVASYVKYFYLPETMQGKKVFVSFQGAESCIAVWLNGHYVGFSSDSFTPHDFELTPYLTEGENKLACKVWRWSAGSWLEDQDFMRFSGLFRDVFLYAAGEVHVSDIRIKTLLDDDYRDAVLDVKVQTQAECEYSLKLTLLDGKNVIASAAGKEQFSIPVQNPDKWSAEHPNLYTLRIEAVNAEGTLCEVMEQKVGFRRFELKDGVMQLNGKRIVFKGTNRHDYCAETGRAVTEEKIRRDLVTMKQHNINAIRTSHYPNHSALYRIADELGLYIIDENNMESHGMWDRMMRGKIGLEDLIPGNKIEWQDMLLDRVNSTYQRDKNHPCILIWSCGNESMGGDVIFEMSQLFRKLDDTRLVHYEGVHHDRRRNETTDMESQMYTPVTKIREYLAEHRERPFILCEYTHSMGNSNGAMHKYTEYAYEEPLYQGGFIWDYLDQSVRNKDRYGNVTFTYGGDHGEHPTDYNFSGNGIVYGDGARSEKMQEVKYNYQNIVAKVEKDSVTIVNRNLFANTSEFDCVVILERDGMKLMEMPMATDVEPLSEKTYLLPFGVQTVGGEYAITVSFRLKKATQWAEAGHEVAFGQGVYEVEEIKTAGTKHRPLHIVYGDSNLGVMGDGFEVLFSYLNGGLASYRFGGKDMFKSIPMPNFWRAPTDNDRGNHMAFRYGQWKLASLYATHRGSFELRLRNMKPPVTEHEDGSVSINFLYDLGTTPAAQCDVTYTVHPCGRVDVKLHHDPVEGLTTMPEFGMMFKMDADYDQLRWYGLGPDENYSDRHEGAKLGIWSRPVKDCMARYLVPQECGNRTGVRWADVTDYRGRGLRFIGKGMEFSALPYTPHELENAAHDYELPPVHYTVVRASLMQMGVAGDDSWGAQTHEEYLIDVSKPLDFEFSFEGIIHH